MPIPGAGCSILGGFITKGGIASLYSPFEAAAALESAFFSAEVCLAFGLQLPFSPGSLPGTGVNPGQHRLVRSAAFVLFPALFFAGAFFAELFFAVAIPA